MKFRLISRVLGIGLIAFSFLQLTPIIVSIIYNEDNMAAFAYSFLITLTFGSFLYLVNFEKKYENFKIIGGGFDGEKIDNAKINFLATLPSMDELRGKIVGLLSAPAQKIASIVKEPAGKMARMMSAQSKKLEESN